MVRYRCVVGHHRLEGVRFSFRYSLRLWLTDLDAPEHRSRLGRLLRSVSAADHLGEPGRSLRENVDHFLHLNGVDLAGGRIVMLSQARGLGYVFDPITVFWCHGPDDRLRCLLLEVRNTFGDRHCYLVRPDQAGDASFDKELYVSPFFPVDGYYASRIRLGDDTVRARIVLRRGGSTEPALVATLTGVREPDAVWRDAWADLTNPVAVRWMPVRIRYQSWRLRRQGLSPRRRRTHPPQPGVQPGEGSDHR